MHLFFLRHGKAEDPPPGLSDFDRRLTQEGIAEMRVVAAGLAALEPRFDLLLSSPLLRALDTARIVAETYQLPMDAIQVNSALSPGEFRLGALQPLLSDLAGNSRVLLVGHEPSFSYTVETLVGGGLIEMKKGGLAYVEADRLEPGRAILRWLLAPKVFLATHTGERLA